MTATKKQITETVREILARWDELPNQGHLDVNIHEARVKLEELLEEDE
jgi:hypothetical protein